MKKFFPIIIILIFTLSSCTSKQAVLDATPSHPPMPTTPPVPTKTPSTTPTATAYEMPTMALPQITFTPIPIKDADYELPSPNKQWTAYAFWEGVPQMTVRNKDGSMEWTVTEGTFPEFPYSYSFIHWTQDSRYLFYNRHYQIDGLMAFYEGAGLYQLDVETGISKEIIPATESRWDRNFATISIAPDDTFLVYILPEDGSYYMTVYDIANETREKHKLEEAGGSFLWAKDQSYVLFSSCTLTDYDDIACSIKKFVFDTGEITTVMPAVNYLVDIDQWMGSQKILWHFRGGDYYTYDLQSGESKLMPNYTPQPGR
jgi:hypothetical protein